MHSQVSVVTNRKSSITEYCTTENLWAVYEVAFVGLFKTVCAIDLAVRLRRSLLSKRAVNEASGVLRITDHRQGFFRLLNAFTSWVHKLVIFSDNYIWVSLHLIFSDVIVPRRFTYFYL